jgi:UTP--glucose-1-phosphate uridylyltransferase
MKKLLLCMLCAYVASCGAKIAQVIIPMAGMGTRLLPLTKTIQKSMVPLVDRPAIHHLVDEALLSGVSDFCFIVNEADQESIENYFSPNMALDEILQARNKSYLLQQLNDVIARSRFTYLVQQIPLGSGDAVLQGERYIIPGSSFCVMFPDDIIRTDEAHLARIIEIAEKYDATVISVEEMTRERASMYAVVTPGLSFGDDLVEVIDIIEKPVSVEKTLCLAPMGRYVFSYDIFEALHAIEPAANGEYQLTDAIRHLVKNGKRVLAYTLHGEWYDIGNVRGLLKATVSLGLENPLYHDMVESIFQQEIKN